MWFILSAVLLATTYGITPIRYDRNKVLRVNPQDEKQANLLKDLAETYQLDFWYPDAAYYVTANMTVDFQVGEKESQFILKALDQNEMHYDTRRGF